MYISGASFLKNMRQRSQVEQKQEQKRRGVLVKCNFCRYIWLCRTNLSFATCSACRNHVKVQYNTVTSDVLIENNRGKS